ncbi:dihydroneopterin aldolase [Spirulina subsalsa FACHB-351]|uniref:7,8-dihydroneopterin aldolase n=1 Tax=Spirulina subsalsa FACHB-351 TaxID=234711 RepID=A0ABT3LC64_9CYAN|nr:dihydroneopterin aldolase [Spirulina subsalsa]MCW6038694.1 dihydroneopterin aldolase [Spirulina subsalsa FACHB-351]
MDAIEVTGLRYYGYVGFLPEEQVLGQWFEVNLTLWLDLSTVGQNDQLDDTLNYAEVVEKVQHLMETSKFKTLERLNTVIIETLLQFERVEKVRSRLIKLSPPIPGFPGHVMIDMTRER